jgi:hypothetical protein
MQKTLARIGLASFLAAAALGLSIPLQVALTSPAEARSSRFCEDYAHGYADRRTDHV